MDKNNIVIVHGVQSGDDKDAVKGPNSLLNALKGYCQLVNNLGDFMRNTD